MIAGIGIDSVEVARFANWHAFAPQQLRKILHEDEIAYCLSSEPLKAQRFAVRFAAREAFFKALCTAIAPSYSPFLTVCRAIHIHRNSSNIPFIKINWPLLNLPENQFDAQISLTHTDQIATAMILLQKK